MSNYGGKHAPQTGPKRRYLLHTLTSLVAGCSLFMVKAILKSSRRKGLKSLAPFPKSTPHLAMPPAFLLRESLSHSINDDEQTSSVICRSCAIAKHSTSKSWLTRKR